MDIFSINKNHTSLIYDLYKSLLKLTILSYVSSRCYAPQAMLLMLARQQAISSEGGFAKLAPFFFHFFSFFFFGDGGLPGLVWIFLWVWGSRLGSSKGVKPASQYW